jgi:dihydroorotate dehydrogenase
MFFRLKSHERPESQLVKSGVERLGLLALRQLDPEKAHGLALTALRLGLTPRPGPVTSPRLQTTLAGIDLPNPIGVAPGFDKNAKAIPALSRTGFGFIEVGAATPLPQPGNPKPRLFRLSEDKAAINRFGFNNDGAGAIAARLAARPKGAVVGLNLGANKNSQDRSDDFNQVLRTCGPHVDFATVNVSSPNTEKLRDLQGKAALSALLDSVRVTRSSLPVEIPIFLKIAPDLTLAELSDVADAALKTGVDAIVATNTTTARDGLHSRHAAETGGLSGAPLFAASTTVLARLYRLTEGRIPLIGVGGVGSASDAYAKITAGASAVQLYTALVFGGLSLVQEIAEGLETLLQKDGFTNVRDAVGQDADTWIT